MLIAQAVFLLHCGKTDKQTNKQTDTTERPTHAGGQANVGNKYAGSPYCRGKIYSCRVTCCPLVSHCENADGTDRRMDGRQTITLLFPLEAVSTITEARLLLNEYLSCHPNNCVKALKWIQSNDYKQVNLPTGSHSFLIHQLTVDGRDATSFTPAIWRQSLHSICKSISKWSTCLFSCRSVNK